MYGTQANMVGCCVLRPFENDVKMYGTQAIIGHRRFAAGFENDVKMYGTQARYKTTEADT